MPIWESLGRIVIASDMESVSYSISQYLTDWGIDATVSLSAEDGLYVVSVPQQQQEQALKQMAHYRCPEKNTLQDQHDYISHCMPSSPEFICAQDHLQDSIRSAIIFLLAGGFIFIITASHCYRVMIHELDKSPLNCFLELLFGIFFFSFGFFMLHRAKKFREQIAAEDAYTQMVVEWFISTYPSYQLDNTIKAFFAGITPSAEELSFHRHGLIRDYIMREYEVDDPLYLEYLVEETYGGIFNKKKLAMSNTNTEKKILFEKKK